MDKAALAEAIENVTRMTVWLWFKVIFTQTRGFIPEKKKNTGYLHWNWFWTSGSPPYKKYQLFMDKTQRRTLVLSSLWVYSHWQCWSMLCLCLWELGPLGLIWWCWFLLFLQNPKLGVPTPYTFPFPICLWELGLLGVGNMLELCPLCPLLHWPTIGDAVWGAVLKCDLLFDLLPLKNIDGRVLLGACT